MSASPSEDLVFLPQIIGVTCPDILTNFWRKMSLCLYKISSFVPTEESGTPHHNHGWKMSLHLLKITQCVAIKTSGTCFIYSQKYLVVLEQT